MKDAANFAAAAPMVPVQKVPSGYTATDMAAINASGAVPLP